MQLKLNVNADELAKELQASVEDTTARLKQGLQKLTIQTHAKVIEIATAKLDGYKLNAYLGDGGSNLGWSQIGDGFYAVTLNAKGRMFEEDAPPRSMATDDWLLKNAKTSKSGSRYKSIPMPVKYNDKTSGPNAAINALARTAIQQARTPDGKRLSTMKLQRGPDGKPKTGIIQKIKIEPPFSSKQAPGLYSQPRSAEAAKATGLKQHNGIFKLSGMAFSQVKKGGRVVKEAVVFRTVSSKNAAESDRWMYPAIKGIYAMDKAFLWLTTEAYPAMIADLKKS